MFIFSYFNEYFFSRVEVGSEETWFTLIEDHLYSGDLLSQIKCMTFIAFIYSGDAILTIWKGETKWIENVPFCLCKF